MVLLKIRVERNGFGLCKNIEHAIKGRKRGSDMKRYMEQIRCNTQGMNRKQRLEYILTYYWYHILGIAATIFLILFFVIHFGFGMVKPEFTCVLINQDINYVRDEKLAETFSEYSGIELKRINVDSDYNLSYGNVRLEGVNESSYEKFFFKWRNNELDAVIMPESFYKYCKEMGGTYRNLGKMKTGNLPLYEDDGIYTAVRIQGTELEKYLVDGIEEMLLVFPADGENQQECGEFLSYMINAQS